MGVCGCESLLSHGGAGCSGCPGLHRGTQERGPSPRLEACQPAAEGWALNYTSRERTANGVGVGEGLAQPGPLKKDILMGLEGRLWAPDATFQIEEQLWFLCRRFFESQNFWFILKNCRALACPFI